MELQDDHQSLRVIAFGVLLRRFALLLHNHQVPRSGRRGWDSRARPSSTLASPGRGPRHEPDRFWHRRQNVSLQASPLSERGQREWNSRYQLGSLRRCLARHLRDLGLASCLGPGMRGPGSLDGDPAPVCASGNRGEGDHHDHLRSSLLRGRSLERTAGPTVMILPAVA